MTDESRNDPQPAPPNTWWNENSVPKWHRMSYLSRAKELLKLWNEARHSARYEDSIFIWIPKNAGTSIYTMLRANGLVKLHSPRSVQLCFRNSGRVTFGHVAIASLVEQNLVSPEFIKNAFKFAFTRDPYDRAASLYRVHGKLMRHWHERPTFVEFLGWLAKGYFDRIGPYDRRGFSQANPQVEWLRYAWPDKLYRVERIDEFISDISERWGISTPQITHSNRSSKDQPVELSRAEKALIEQIYAEDFETFGYSKR